MSEINLPAFLAARIRDKGNDLVKAFGKMPADRQTWHPPVEGNVGRDALDQIVECGLLNGYFADAFRSGQIPTVDWDAYTAKKATIDSGEKALAALKEGNEALASAVGACSPSRLAETFVHPFYQKETNFAEFADFFYWNMCYHEGQINYIQVLYGDMS
jgi:hypothetical protein